jgi:hypothetical protein
MPPVRDLATARGARAVLSATRRALERTPATARSPRALEALASVIAAQRAVASAVELSRSCLDPAQPGRSRRWASRPTTPCLTSATDVMAHAAGAAEAALRAGAPSGAVIEACLISLQELAGITPGRR